MTEYVMKSYKNKKLSKINNIYTSMQDCGSDNHTVNKLEDQNVNFDFLQVTISYDVSTEILKSY